MKRSALLLAVCGAAGALAQTADGSKVFRQSCAIGYCHGSGGMVGRAPALVDRKFAADYVMKVTRDGIPNTGMPAWKDKLNAAELNAVVAYVVKISGGTGTAVTTAGAQALPQAAGRGRDLFFDAVRGTRCSTCHAVEGKGVAVGPNLAAGPAPVNLIREGKPSTVRQARIGADAFPALLVEQKGDWVRLYDLSVAPPALRTVAKSDVAWSGGGSWKHANAVSNYSDAELREVADYLKWLSSR